MRAECCVWQGSRLGGVQGKIGTVKFASAHDFDRGLFCVRKVGINKEDRGCGTRPPCQRMKLESSNRRFNNSILTPECECLPEKDQGDDDHDTHA